MLEITASFSHSMAKFSTGDISQQHLTALGAQSLDQVLASAPRHPPPTYTPRKGMNGAYLYSQQRFENALKDSQKVARILNLLTHK